MILVQQISYHCSSCLTYDRVDMVFAHYRTFWGQMRKHCVMKLFNRNRAESWESVEDEVKSLVKLFHPTPERQ